MFIFITNKKSYLKMTTEEQINFNRCSGSAYRPVGKVTFPTIIPPLISGVSNK
jgi:hypothetical protein